MMYIFRSSECTVKEIELMTPCSQVFVLLSKLRIWTKQITKIEWNKLRFRVSCCLQLYDYILCQFCKALSGVVKGPRDINRFIVLEREDLNTILYPENNGWIMFMTCEVCLYNLPFFFRTGSKETDGTK